MLVNIFLLFLNFYTDLYVACKLKNFQFNLNTKNSSIIFIISIIYALLLKFNLYNSSKILLTFVMLFILFKKIFNLNTFSIIQLCFFTIIIMIIAEQFTSIIFTKILNITLYTIKSNKFYLLLCNLMIFVIYVFTINAKCVFVKLFNSFCNINIDSCLISNIFVTILTCVILFIYSQIYRYFNKYFNDKIFLFIIILCIFFAYICLTFLYANHLSTENLKILKLKEKEYTQLKIYSKSIENLIDDISKFKHDYNNIMFMLNGYLENNDYDSLKKCINKKVFLQEKYYDIGKLKLICNSGIKGLLSAKISKMTKNNLKVTINILNTITDIFIDELDLCRILGVFLDNALEASMNSNEKFVTISFIQDINSLNITIINSYRSNNLNINSIYKKGYSSKGNNRGIGLYNVSYILNEKYPNILLNTYAKNNTFIQDIYIKEG